MAICEMCGYSDGHSKKCAKIIRTFDGAENTHKESACPECSRLASRVEELEKLIAKHSGSLNSADSAARITSDPATKEIRRSE